MSKMRISLLVFLEGVMNERFVAVVRIRGLGCAVALLRRDLISVSRGVGNR